MFDELHQRLILKFAGAPETEDDADREKVSVLLCDMPKFVY